MIDPIYQFPFDERSWMAPAFGTWYKSEGKQGTAPTTQMKELMNLYNQYKSSVNSAKQLQIAKKIVKLSTERLNAIGTVGMSPGLVVVKNNFHNVMEHHTSDWLVFTPGTMDPPQFWMDE
jgi:ABC-type transport system substrate-binding protein